MASAIGFDRAACCRSVGMEEDARDRSGHRAAMDSGASCHSAAPLCRCSAMSISATTVISTFRSSDSRFWRDTRGSAFRVPRFATHCWLPCGHMYGDHVPPTKILERRCCSLRACATSLTRSLPGQGSGRAGAGSSKELCRGGPIARGERGAAAARAGRGDGARLHAL